MRTTLDIHNESFLINGQETYSENEHRRLEVQGLLMNARFIQGVFDDKADPSRFARFGWESWDAERNTREMIASLPEWYPYGLRAITVGFQGGMPVFTITNETIDNNPYSEDGSRIDEKYLARMDAVIRAADQLGMIVIVSLLYQGQSPRLKNGRSIRNAISAGCRFLRANQYSNVIVEVANECNVGQFCHHPLVSSTEGAASLLDLARTESGGLPVGCSMGGGDYSREIAESSDVILIHGNGLTRQAYYNQVAAVRDFGLNKPIVCNEDSPCIRQLDVAYDTRTSWGYYNNFTKQEPPVDWSVTKGEDFFFARRMARGIGIPVMDIPKQDQYYFQGFEPRATVCGLRWLRVASEFPETIDRVRYFRNGNLVDIAYNEPFFLYYQSSWIQRGVDVNPNDRWMAEVQLIDGATVVLEKNME